MDSIVFQIGSVDQAAMLLHGCDDIVGNLASIKPIGPLSRNDIQSSSQFRQLQALSSNLQGV